MVEERAQRASRNHRTSVASRLVACVDFGSTFTKAALVDVDRARCWPRRRTAPRSTPTSSTAGTPAGRSWTPSTRRARRRGAGLLLGRRRPADRRGRQRGAGHRRGRTPGGAVQRRPGGARRPRGPGPGSPRRGCARAVPTSCCSSGGTDGGNTEVLLACAARAGRGAAGAAPVVVAGNVDARDEVAAAARPTPGRRTSSPTTWCPRIGVLTPESARAAIREMFLRHVIGGKHLSARATRPADLHRDGPRRDPRRGAHRCGAARPRPRRGAPRRRRRGGRRRRRGHHRRALASWRSIPRTPAWPVRWWRTRAGHPHRRGRPRHALERGARRGGGARRRGARPRTRRCGCAVPPGYDASSRRSCPATPEEVHDDERIAAAAVAVALRRHAGRQRVVFAPDGRLVERTRQGPARGRPARRLRRRAAQQRRRPGRPGARRRPSGRCPAVGRCPVTRGWWSTTTTCSRRRGCWPQTTPRRRTGCCDPGVSRARDGRGVT